jgi:hypothetical protein
MTLPSLISAYGDSLTRMDAERELQKELTAKAEQLAITPQAFKAAAVAFHRDKVAELREATQERLMLLEALA